jgi:hypothetical protein
MAKKTTKLVGTGSARRPLSDLAAYPVLTEQVTYPLPTSSPAAPGGTPSGGPGGSSLGQIAARAVSDVLGWKLNPADPKGFVGALTSSFTLTDVEGHVESTWSPRTYAVQTDLGGGITGAQASLYSRTKEAVDECLSLIDGLYPLDPDADSEYVTALREMAKSQMNEIVKEMGVVPPSILRINTYFKILLGQENISFRPGVTTVEFDPDGIGGTLGNIRDIYGIKFRGNLFSNSIEDEQDITNFRIISDYMTSLLQSWISNGGYFELGNIKKEAFLGTQLVLISRQFSVVVETINEVRFTMDSVFIGPAERQTLLLKFPPNKSGTGFPAMFFEDMLREIENLCLTEGPRLLQDGGRIAVTNNILPVATTLRELVAGARTPENAAYLPDGYRTIRVRNSLDDLHDQIRELIRLATQIGRSIPPPDQPQLGLVGAAYPTAQAPVPGSVSLKQGSFGGTTGPAISVYGTGFMPGLTVVFEGGGAPPPKSFSVTFYSGQRIDVTLAPTPVPARGTYDLVVINPGPNADRESLTVDIT